MSVKARFWAKTQFKKNPDGSFLLRDGKRVPTVKRGELISVLEPGQDYGEEAYNDDWTFIVDFPDTSKKKLLQLKEPLYRRPFLHEPENDPELDERDRRVEVRRRKWRLLVEDFADQRTTARDRRIKKTDLDNCIKNRDPRAVKRFLATGREELEVTGG